VTVIVQSVSNHYSSGSREHGCQLKRDCRGGRSNAGALAKLSVSRPSSAQSVAKEVSNLKVWLKLRWLTIVPLIEINQTRNPPSPPPPFAPQRVLLVILISALAVTFQRADWCLSI
jgi:hypothetical protein